MTYPYPDPSCISCATLRLREVKKSRYCPPHIQNLFSLPIPSLGNILAFLELRRHRNGRNAINFWKDGISHDIPFST